MAEILNIDFKGSENTEISETVLENMPSLSKLKGKDGKALMLRLCRGDIRISDIKNENVMMKISADISLEKGCLGAYTFCVGTQSALCALSGTGGKIFSVSLSKKGVPALFSNDGKELAELSYGKEYRIEANIVRCTDICTIDIDGYKVGESVLPKKVYYITGALISAENTEENSAALCISALEISGRGKALPQKNMYQAKGEMPEVKLPGTKIPSVLTLFCNKTNMQTEPVLKDGKYFVPLLTVLRGCEINYEIKDGKIRFFANGRERIIGGPCDIEYTGDGKEGRLCGHVYSENGTIMVSTAAVNVLLGAKIWYDEQGNMLTVTTKEYLDDILRDIGGRFYMNGEPYYEISFNKFDLNWQIAADGIFNGGKFPSAVHPSAEYTIPAAERALRQLSENGFKTIRVFCDTVSTYASKEERERFYSIADTMYDMCDKYGIKVVVSLFIYSAHFFDSEYDDEIGRVYRNEGAYELTVDPSSRSRQNMYDYINEYVGRYSKRKTVLMWEIINEPNLTADLPGHLETYSAIQLGDFYRDCAAAIHKADPERLVTTGDATIRPCQWHLLKATMDGKGEEDWSIDTEQQRKEITHIINHGMDAISIHSYNIGYEETEKYIDDDGEKKFVTFENFVKEAKACGKPLYNGETGGYIFGEGVRSEVHPNTDPRNKEGRCMYIDTIIDAGIQLTHLWTFSSARANSGCDNDTWNISVENTPDYFFGIKEENEKIKKKYLVNSLRNDNIIKL